MEYKQTINGVDHAPYIKEGGVEQSDILRNQQSIVTMDGVLHTAAVVKRRIVTQLLEVTDSRLRTLMGSLTTPATVDYTDRDAGDVSKTFHVTLRSAGAKTVRGGVTYWSGASYTLEEM